MRKQRNCVEKEMMQGTMPGARRRRRPRTAWMDNKTWTGLPVEESVGMTEDRDKWRKYTSMVWPTLGSRTAKEQNRTEDGAVAHHQQYSVRLAVASGKFIHQVRWSWHQKSIFARITRLFGFSGKYSSVTGRDSWWLSAVA